MLLAAFTRVIPRPTALAAIGCAVLQLAAALETSCALNDRCADTPGSTIRA